MVTISVTARLHTINKPVVKNCIINSEAKTIFHKNPTESVAVLMEKCLKAIEGIV